MTGSKTKEIKTELVGWLRTGPAIVSFSEVACESADRIRGSMRRFVAGAVLSAVHSGTPLEDALGRTVKAIDRGMWLGIWRKPGFRHAQILGLAGDTVEEIRDMFSGWIDG